MSKHSNAKIFGLAALILIAFALYGCSASPTVEYETASDIPASETEGVSQEDRFPLLSAAEDENIYLYGIKPSGMVLYIDGSGYYYDWKYENSSGISPCVFAGNFSEDDTLSAVVYLCYTDDGGEDMSELYLIDTEDPENPVSLDLSAIDGETEEVIDYSVESEDITFTFGDKNFIFDLSESFSKFVFKSVSYSQNLEFFEDDGSLYVNIVPVISSGDDGNDYGSISLAMTITAKVTITDGDISLSEFSVKGL
ncbi:MAG: hypothetical protein LUG85_06450 [Clostridiales bacterium]|nr:hypothetical protein [Clostridiales bacterium]